MCLLSVEYPSDRHDGAVAGVADLDPVTWIGSMYDLPASDIDTYMTAVAYQVTWRGFRKGSYRYAVISLGSIIMRKAYAEIRVDRHGKTRAVRTVCK